MSELRISLARCLACRTMLSSYNNHIMYLDSFNNKIESIARQPKYQKKVKVLGCIRGLDTLSAMCLIAEIIDINRFSHPKYLTSFAGLDISEYSSCGKEKCFSITKQGNRFIRTIVAEATQYAFRIPNILRKIKDRRKGADPRLIDIGDRCMHRLYKKLTKMIFRGKPRNKIKIACAREMLGFIWESLKLVS
ncbi:transposase [Candidatus Auribacterota bacterium]